MMEKIYEKTTAAACSQPKCEGCEIQVMTDHCHILLRSSIAGLPTFMRRFLSGYAVSYNRRHRRYGHLFQNRYKSIVCEEDRYFKELVPWSCKKA